MVCFFTSYLKQTADSIASRLRLRYKYQKKSRITNDVNKPCLAGVAFLFS